MQNKNILIAILWLTILLLVPFNSISGASVGGLNTKDEISEFPYVVSDTTTLSLHTFDKTGEKQREAILPMDSADEIYDVLEELKYKILYEPMSDETKALKIEFVDLLDIYGLIPEDLSKSYVLSLLNPSWLDDKQSKPKVITNFPLLRGFLSHILGVFVKLQQFFKLRFIETNPMDFDENILPSLPYNYTVTATFCLITSMGNGTTIPLFLLPRPRGVAMWYGYATLTAAGEPHTGKSFFARHEQLGFALGFLGLGFTDVSNDYYLFLGCALFTWVNAEYICVIP